MPLYLSLMSYVVLRHDLLHILGGLNSGMSLLIMSHMTDDGSDISADLIIQLEAQSQMLHQS